MAQPLPIHSWKSIVPCEVSAVKLGASSFMRNMGCPPEAGGIIHGSAAGDLLEIRSALSPLGFFRYQGVLGSNRLTAVLATTHHKFCASGPVPPKRPDTPRIRV